MYNTRIVKFAIYILGRFFSIFVFQLEDFEPIIFRKFRKAVTWHASVNAVKIYEIRKKCSDIWEEPDPDPLLKPSSPNMIQDFS